MASYKNLERLRQLITDGSLLPANLTAKVLHYKDEDVARSGKIRADAVIEFSLKDVAVPRIQAVIEFKSRLTPLILEGTIHQLLGITNYLRDSGLYPDAYPMVAAPYLSEAIQNRCRELGIGYIDLNGTLLLAHKGVYVNIVRPATVHKNPQGIKKVFTGQSRRIARMLLANPFQPFRLEEIASATRLSVGQVFQVTKRLHEDGFLERTSQGRMLTRPRPMLRAFAKELRENYSDQRHVFRGFTEEPSESLTKRLAQLCSDRQIRCAFTLGSGLEPYERNMREQMTAAYLEIDGDLIRDELRIEAVDRGANVLLMTPPKPDNTDAGGVFYRTRLLESSGLVGVHPVQLYIDFSMQGGRGEEQAEFLLEHTLHFHK